jgi:hypothetical protein
MSVVIPGVTYKIQMYEWVGNNYTSATSANNIGTKTNSSSGDWTPLPSDSVSKTFNTSSAIMFVVTVVETSSGRLLDEGANVQVSVQCNTADIQLFGTAHNNSGGADLQNGGHNASSNDHWWGFYIPTKATSRQFTAADFSITLPDTSQLAQSLYSAVHGGPFTGTGTVTPYNVFPITLNVTNATVPSLPGTITAFLGKGNIVDSVFNTALSQWIVTAKISGNYIVYTFPKPWYIIPLSNYYAAPTSPASPGKYTYKTFKTLSDALKDSTAAAIAGSGSTKTTNPPSPKGAVQTSSQLNQAPYTSQWNPPPHAATKGVSFSDFLAQEAFSGDSLAYSGPSLSTSYNTNDAALVALETSYRSRLGRLFQDTANITKTNKKSQAPWGFHFMYNPNNINYSSTSDTSIDWTLGKADPSNAIGGNTTVSFQLYLNRIIDVKDLRTNGPSALARAYPGYSKAGDVFNGITTRGTEYDLEYLYRVLNGDPLKGEALLSSGDLTSDVGYITMAPFWLHIHDNMRYFGSMASLSVNHLIFTSDMVPVFSTVDISFIRYPATGNQGVSASQWQNKYLGTVTSTGAGAAPTGKPKK